MSKMTAHEWEIAFEQLEDEHKATLGRIERAIAYIKEIETYSPLSQGGLELLAILEGKDKLEGRT